MRRSKKFCHIRGGKKTTPYNKKTKTPINSHLVKAQKKHQRSLFPRKRLTKKRKNNWNNRSMDRSPPWWEAARPKVRSKNLRSRRRLTIILRMSLMWFMKLSMTIRPNLLLQNKKAASILSKHSSDTIQIWNSFLRKIWWRLYLFRSANPSQ